MQNIWIKATTTQYAGQRIFIPRGAADRMRDKSILEEQSLFEHVLSQLWLDMHGVELDILVIGQQKHYRGEETNLWNYKKLKSNNNFHRMFQGGAQYLPGGKVERVMLKL